MDFVVSIKGLKKLFIGILLLLVSGVAWSQKQVEHQQQIWFGYTNTIRFNPTWFLVTEVQERRFINPSAPFHFLLRTHIHRDLGSGWDAAAGFSLFLQSPNDPESEIDLTIPELRPHLEFNLRQKLNSFNIEQRYRAEARFFHNVNSTLTDLDDGYSYGTLRLRYRIQFIFPVIKSKGVNIIKLKAGDELMVNVGENIVHNFFDQNRLYAGVIFVLGPAFSLEAGYINWFQQQKSGVDYYNRDIFAFYFQHTIESKRTP